MSPPSLLLLLPLLLLVGLVACRPPPSQADEHATAADQLEPLDASGPAPATCPPDYEETYELPAAGPNSSFTSNLNPNSTVSLDPENPNPTDILVPLCQPSISTTIEVITKVITPILFTLICIVGLLGNVIVMLVILDDRKLERELTPTNLLILDLSLADLSFILFCIPFTGWDYAIGHWIFGSLWCKFNQYLIVVCALSSIYTLVLMSVDRFMAIVYPIECISYRTSKNILLAIIIKWLIILLMASPTIQMHGLVESPLSADQFSCRFLADQHNPLHFQIVFFVTSYLFPLILIFCLYLSLLNKLWFGARPHGHKESLKMLESKKRVTWLVASIVIVFALCWFPIQIMLILMRLKLHKITATYVAIQVFAHTLGYTNSCVNPIVYAFASETFHQSFRRSRLGKLLGCCYSQHSSSSADSRPSEAAANGPASAAAGQQLRRLRRRRRRRRRRPRSSQLERRRLGDDEEEEEEEDEEEEEEEDDDEEEEDEEEELEPEEAEEEEKFSGCSPRGSNHTLANFYRSPYDGTSPGPTLGQSAVAHSAGSQAQPSLNQLTNATNSTTLSLFHCGSGSGGSTADGQQPASRNHSLTHLGCSATSAAAKQPTASPEPSDRDQLGSCTQSTPVATPTFGGPLEQPNCELTRRQPLPLEPRDRPTPEEILRSSQQQHKLKSRQPLDRTTATTASTTPPLSSSCSKLTNDEHQQQQQQHHHHRHQHQSAALEMEDKRAAAELKLFASSIQQQQQPEQQQQQLQQAATAAAKQRQLKPNALVPRQPTASETAIAALALRQQAKNSVKQQLVAQMDQSNNQIEHRCEPAGNAGRHLNTEQ